MTALETLRLKITDGKTEFSGHTYTLFYDPRHNKQMPWHPGLGRFLEDLRRTAPEPRNKYEAQAQAKHMVLSAFDWDCPTHGRTSFSTRNGSCIKCARKERETNPARSQAEGSTYRHRCAVHGEVDFSKVRGLCLSCYNTLGKPRPKSTNPRGAYVDRDGIIRSAPG